MLPLKHNLRVALLALPVQCLEIKRSRARSVQSALNNMISIGAEPIVFCRVSVSRVEVIDHEQKTDERNSAVCALVTRMPTCSGDDYSG